MRLLACYIALWVLALLAIALATLPLTLKALLWLACALHARWTLPRKLLLTHPYAWRAIRHDAQGWHLFSHALGWQAVQLRPYSLALPIGVSLSVKSANKPWVQNLFIARDALPIEVHRRLRVRLKFSRQRWQAPK